MKSILVYGDSLTWGLRPTEGPPEPVARHLREDRWPNVLAGELGGDADVVCDALRGRTTAYDDHLGAEIRNGAATLPTVLGTHAPLDLVIIMLGTNDLKRQQGGTAFAAMRGMARLVEIVRSHPPAGTATPPAVMVVAPPQLCPTGNAAFNEIFAGAKTESTRLAGLYRTLAGQTECAFFDAGTVAETSPVDGVHLDAANARRLGHAIAEVVRAMLVDR